MRTPPTATLGNLALLALGALTLSACEFRRDSVEEEPVAEATDSEAGTSPEATPTATDTPSASIIRDENTPENDIQLPPEPVDLTIPFPEGSTIDARAERLLAGILTSRALERDWPVVISGHMDSAGNDEANMRASRARAEAVAAWLIERGVADDRIEVIAFGEQNPIAPNALPDGSPNTEGRRSNRRVELRIAPPRVADESEQESASTQASDQATSNDE